MNTAQEILKKHTGHSHGLMDCSVIEAMKEYAQLIAQQALNNASENAKVLTKNLDTENELEVICWTNERNVKFSVSKSSITNPDNIPLTI
ncbi:hypothetical protein [Sphingobacterium kyonggiense]